MGTVGARATAIFDKVGVEPPVKLLESVRALGYVPVQEMVVAAMKV